MGEIEDSHKDDSAAKTEEDKHEKNEKKEDETGQENEEKKKKDEEAQGESDGREEEKKKKNKNKNPEDKKDPAKMKQKLEKIEAKMQDLAIKKEEIIKFLNEAEKTASNPSAESCSQPP